ncbi:MAG: radical SAM family heme chaperone HemW [Deltaproteobacteria bacterium]|nr:radical SAM family heme chaperone HemW [Deltaproteobacteria bacterium]
MLGVYVHFPYCAHRCSYCDFALVTPRAIPAARYTDAVLAELALRVALGQDPRLAKTLYVGGGTPSLWPVSELARLLADIPRAPDAEVTLEANPEQCTAAWLADVTALGVNRVSLGVQSLDDAELARLTRAHGVAGAEAALDALAGAHSRGALRSFSVDLIYGLPDQTADAFLAQLDRLVARWAPPHLSLYALTVEPRTVLARDIRRGVVAAPDDALQGDLVFVLRDHLAARGYLHYEVSSWARPGHLAVHNAAYWDMSPYLGLGAGAHGFVGGERWSNLTRPSRYIDEALAGRLPVATAERPDARTLAFERLMTGLRRLDVGLAWGDDLAPFADGLATFVAEGQLARGGDRLRVTDRGLRFLDALLARLL